jgi:hypothetical protein
MLGNERTSRATGGWERAAVECRREVEVERKVEVDADGGSRELRKFILQGACDEPRHPADSSAPI